MGADVDPAVALDRQQAAGVEDGHRTVRAESDGERARALRHAVVEEFKEHRPVPPQGPGEEQPRHAREGLDVVRQQILDRLVAPELLAPLPGALHRLLRRRDHELQVDLLAEPGQELPGAVGLRGEAVEAEAVDQQVREAAGGGLAGDVPVELGIDDLDLVAGERPGVAARRS